MPFKSVSITNTTAFTVATPQTGISTERVRLVGGWLASNATTTVQFQTSTGSAALSGAMPLAANTPFVIPCSPANPADGRRFGYLQSLAGDSLLLVNGTANTTLNGVLEYILISD